MAEYPEPGSAEVPRSLSNAIIAGFVLLQLLVPIGIYFRGDAYDDRFNWMSLVGYAPFQCQPALTESRIDGEIESVSLDDSLHFGWIRHIRNNRRAVIDALLVDRCDRERIHWARLVNECRFENRSVPTTLDYRLDCQNREFIQPNPVSLVDTK
ncbi:MAG: hypothetical protein R3A47_10980 [Polyangiales bacterium]